MKRLRVVLLALSSLILFYACSYSCDDCVGNDQDRRCKTEAEELTSLAGEIMSSSLDNSLEKTGLIGSLEKCDLNKYSFLSDLENQFNCEIQRLSDRSRNLKSSLKTQSDYKVWEEFKEAYKSKPEIDTLLVNKKGELVYYKTISIDNKSCLNCHGNEKNMTRQFKERLSDLYPQDKAKNYLMNDLRGVWKVTFKNQQNK
ncbi:c-type heme family protein [Aureibacter tunicatorum]|uniref:Tll0287-like domain-containing protein n=1 Tax=Aureibacter tunicatorum TaxID=866807 RepID=A0AAE3XU56_9BACT|nr:DUF3365 domain-containing protein [Aureibacter tunicatorum]MDR6242055.1 hypothetical protein [Aureibacter tunicatorum]BDD03630.1 hypothetical protein AUTU_11130 [Aureibacter tunicatorum]